MKIRRVPEQLGDVILVPIMFPLLFTYLFGGALAGSTDAYLDYLLPGILVQAVLFVTIFSGVVLNTDIATGVLDRFRTLPIWRPSVLVGALMGDTGRYMLASALVLAVGFLLGYRPGGGLVGVAAAVALVLVFAFSLSWIWLSFGLVLRSPNAVQIGGLVILFPLTFASNVFVNPKTTPSWLQTFIEINPVSHLVTATRGLMGGTSSGIEIVAVLVTCAVLVAAFAPLTMHLYGRKT